MREAVEAFIAEDFARPRDAFDDVKLGLPAGKPILEEVKLHRHAMFIWPDLDECPDHLLESWLEMIRGDMNNISRLLNKERVEGERVLNKYQAMADRLRKRLEVRDK